MKAQLFLSASWSLSQPRDSKPKETKDPLRRDRTWALTYLLETPDVIQAGKKNSAKFLNQLLKAECGLCERTGPLGASDTGEFILTHRPFGDLSSAHKKDWGQDESQSFPSGSGLGEGSS